MPTVREYAALELDKNYRKTAVPVLNAIQALSGNDSVLKRKLLALMDEAMRLEGEEERLDYDNPYLQEALQANLEQWVTAQNLIIANGRSVQDGGKTVAVPSVTSRLLLGLTAVLLAQNINPVTSLNVYKQQSELTDWVYLEGEQLDKYIGNYVATEAWQNRMDTWGVNYNKIIERNIIDYLSKGASPTYVANYLTQLSENTPISAADNLLRTLQINAYRDAERAMEIANQQYIYKKIRVAVLDERTCLMCVALHGTVMEPGEQIQDHYRGRCTAIYVPVGSEVPPTQNGEQWFESLSEERQKKQASFVKNPAKYRAYKDGVPLSAFVGEHTDDIFGEQFIENSLKKAIGKDAEKYYNRNVKGDE